MKETLDDIKEDKNWFCPLPFNHIYSNSDGSWMPCCLSRPTIVPDKNIISSDKKIMHNTENTSMIDWWKSDTMNGIRDEMIGKSKETKLTDHYCFKCKNQERVEGTSSRIGWKNSVLGTLSHHKSSMASIVAVDSYKDCNEMDLSDIDDRFLSLKLRIFGNLCNLSCYMCWPHNSSTRINDVKKLPNEYKDMWFKSNVTDDGIPKSISKVNKDQFQSSLEQIKDIAHLISSIKITGGEPMMMDNHYRLLDLLIDSGDAKHIQLRYQTNFTKFSRGEEAFFKYMKEFESVAVHISIDSVGEYDEYIRKNGSTDVVNKNIDKLRNLPNVSFGIANTVSMLSILNHAEFHEKWKDVYVNYFVLTAPDYLSVKHLPDKIKQRLITETTQESIIKMLKQERDDSQFQIAIKYCLDLDMLYKRNKGIFDLWPELEEYYVQPR
jgi:organic radical activating enzyme